MKTTKLTARIFGISFLIGYFSYGIGFGHLNSIMNSADSLLYFSKHKNVILFDAAILMAIFAPINIVLGIIMTPIFKSFNQTLTYGYLCFSVVSSTLLIIGAIFLLTSLNLSDHIGNSNSQLFFELLKSANFYSYQIGMFFWGIGGILFSYLLLISRIVPKWLSIWGIIGYIIFISGAIFAIFGFKIDIYLDIPGGLFELFLSFWFIFKGFNLQEK